MNYAIQNTGGMLLGKKISSRHSRTTDILLEKTELFRLDGDRRGLLVQAVEGRVWLTQTGDERDIVLEKGQSFQIDRRGAIWLEGMPSARVRFSLGCTN